jgi:uncharacterized ferredoxin-like protein
MFTENKQVKAKDMDYASPHCVMRMMDIGIALSSSTIDQTFTKESRCRALSRINYTCGQKREPEIQP